MRGEADTGLAVPIPRRIDVRIEIDFPENPSQRAVIRTNASKEGLEEILECWLRCEIGQGEDAREPAERDLYRVVIEVDLSDDTLFTESDTGNKSLTCGIVMRVFDDLHHLDIQPLSG